MKRSSEARLVALLLVVLQKQAKAAWAEKFRVLDSGSTLRGGQP